MNGMTNKNGMYNYAIKEINAFFCALNHIKFTIVKKCKTTFEIQKLLKVTHDGTSQVKEFRLISLTRKYELFKIKPNKDIQETHTRFIIFVNEKEYKTCDIRR